MIIFISDKKTTFLPWILHINIELYVAWYLPKFLPISAINYFQIQVSSTILIPNAHWQNTVTISLYLILNEIDAPSKSHEGIINFCNVKKVRY